MKLQSQIISMFVLIFISLSSFANDNQATAVQAQNEFSESISIQTLLPYQRAKGVEIITQSVKHFSQEQQLKVNEEHAINNATSNNDIELTGNFSYQINGNYVVLTADRITNNRNGGQSGTLSIELWATTSPYNGSATNGYQLASHSIGQLNAGSYYSNISSGSLQLSQPPAGTYYLSLIVTEYGNGVVDYGNFSGTKTFGNDNGDGTGIELSGNYSYQINGQYAQIAADQVINNRNSGTSGTLSLELWATSSPYQGGDINGYKVADYHLGQLNANEYFSNINSGNVTLSQPPAGTYYMTLILTEYGSGIVDHGSFNETRTFGGSNGSGSGIDLQGNFSYQINNGYVELSADKISNNRNGGRSGSLYLELWATTSAYQGGQLNGYKLADYHVGQLNGGQYFSNISSGSLYLSQPPAGTYYLTLVVTEYGNGLVDYGNFNSTHTFGDTSGGGSGINLQGNYSYNIEQGYAVLTADKISNNRNGGSSGTLYLELWATSTSYQGGSMSGYKLASYRLGELTGGQYYSNISSGSIEFSPPPAGTYHMTLVVNEYGNGIVDFGTFNNTKTFHGGGTGNGNIDLSGQVSYQFSGDYLTLLADKISNHRANGTSGSISLELWATTSRYNGGNISGYKLASHYVGELQAGEYFSNINSGSILFSRPAEGSYYLTMIVSEHGNGIVDYVVFDDVKTFTNNLDIPVTSPDSSSDSDGGGNIDLWLLGLLSLLLISRRVVK